MTTLEKESQEKVCENCGEIPTDGYCQLNDSLTCNKCLNAPNCLHCSRPLIISKLNDHHADCINVKLAMMLADDGNRNIFFNILGENR